MEREIVKAKVYPAAPGHKWTWWVEYSDGITEHGPVHDDLLDDHGNIPDDEALRRALVIDCPGQYLPGEVVIVDAKYPTTEREVTSPPPRAAVWPNPGEAQ